MRDAFGGVFMIRLMLVFLFIYVAFTAVSLNYAKAFRIKNKVIDYVEQMEILDLNTFFASANNSKIAKLDKIIDNAKYDKQCRNGNGPLVGIDITDKAYCYRGVIIEKTGSDSGNIYYDVKTYADWNLGAFNMLLRLGGKSKNSKDIVDGAWEISGRAKVVNRLNTEIKK